MIKYINIYVDILYRYSTSDYLNIISKAYLEKISPSNILLRLWICMVWIIRDSINPLRTFIIKRRRQEVNPKGKIWIFISSKNHFDSVGFLRKTLDDTIIVVPHIRRLEMTDYIFPYYFKIFYYIKLPFLWIGLLYQRSSIAYRYFNFLFEAIGIYEISLKKLRKLKPKAIIFANDHIPKHRALLLAAKQLNIKTYYLQHASISNTYPPLSFDLALLEGKDSFIKYKLCGEISSEVKFVGMPKFDEFLKNRKELRNEIESIGIAANPLDKLKYIYLLIHVLNTNFKGKRVCLRMHPQDKRTLKHDLLDYEISDPNKEKAFDFLKSVDFLISGESSIHLESALLYIPSITFGFNDENHVPDYYEYVKNGLIQKAKDISEIIDIIRNNKYSVNIEKLRYYNDVVGTNWEGKSKELITEIITKDIY